ncbi:hypothetical protein [Paenibacillus faecalis]|uniref:hypothetical protein n=1 Tax=Paenibacillus faecalis TaxID=2079532 RepID=UPI000D0FEDF0|nr:hypothetical protein [Paenibacillus faecalis]
MKNQILNRFIGVIDERDEYQLQEIYKELAYSGILLWGLSVLVMFVSLIIDTINNELSFSTPALFIINMIYATMVTARLRKKQLDATDCVSMDEYIEKKNLLKKSAVFAGIQWGLSMIILMEFIFPYLSTGEINVRWWSLFIWTLVGMISGVIFYRFLKSKLKKQF